MSIFLCTFAAESKDVGFEKYLKTDYMKKIILMMAALFAITAQAASYGILVNGKTYFPGTDAGEFEGWQQYLVHVKVQAGDYCQLYDADYQAAWAVKLNAASESGFTLDANANKYIVSVTGCYDFYIKLKFEADELYIGVGSNCGEGINIAQEDSTSNYGGAVPAQCTDVMLQAFYWSSYQSTTASNSATSEYGRTKWIDFLNGNNGTSAEEVGAWFDLIWLPPMSYSTGGVGYLPVNYGKLDSDWGTKTKLVELISKLHANGAKVVADIVINHAVAPQGWCNYNQTYDFGEYGTYTPTGSYICQTDEINTSSSAGDCRGYATGAADDGYGEEANYLDARDWDHTNPEVQNMLKAYLKWLQNDIQIDGFRYDYCKGFHNSHIDDYNNAAQPYFSVMEMWDGDVNTLQSHLNDANWNTLTFDFALKYQAFNNGIVSDYYKGLKGAGLIGAGKSRYAVTFIDNHDMFQRDDNELCGLGNSMTICRDKIMACYAYLLSMPGIPCVFFPHWVTFKEQLKSLINVRYKTGVHSESAVSDEAGDGYYKATITGTNGEIKIFIGPNSGYNDTPRGFTKALTGENYGVYYTLIEERDDKNKRAAKPQLEVQAYPEYAGTVSVNNDSVITAIPNEGYRFVCWNDSVTDNPRTITLTQDTLFIAYFAQIEKIYSITVQADSTENGSVMGGGEYMQGETAVIMATPRKDCTFEGWSDGNQLNPRSVVVESDSLFTAIFHRNIPLPVVVCSDTMYFTSADTLLMATRVYAPSEIEAYDKMIIATVDNKNVMGGQAVEEGDVRSYRQTVAFSPNMPIADVTVVEAVPNGTYYRLRVEDGELAPRCEDCYQKLNQLYATEIGADWYFAQYENAVVPEAAAYANRMILYNEEAPRFSSYRQVTGLNRTQTTVFKLHTPRVIPSEPEVIEEDSAALVEEEKPIEEISVEIEPQDTVAVISTPYVEFVHSFTLIVWADEARTQVLMMITYDASGHVISVTKPNAVHRHAPRADGDITFEIDDLEPETTYPYTLVACEDDGSILTSLNSSFTTTNGTEGIQNVFDHSSQTVKFLMNGQLFILRDGKLYNAFGVQVK